MEINARKRETKLVENNRILAQLEAVLELHKQGTCWVVTYQRARRRDQFNRD